MASFLVREGYLKEVVSPDEPTGVVRHIATDQGRRLCDEPPRGDHDPLAEVVQRWLRERSVPR